ncbi:MAG: GGDEF domain-containing protein [Pseudomonadota bacterium]
MEKSAAAPEAGAEPSQARHDRRRLIDALGLDVSALPVEARAALEALAGEVLSLRNERAAMLDELGRAEQLADRDTLCPVFNRRAFERELSREIALAARYGSPLCLIFVDLDRFKLVNDRFGHATGDTVLREVTNLILGAIRQTDIVGRLGGDEFGIALTHADLADSQAKADYLTSLIDGLTIRDQADSGLEPVQLGASCGVVAWQKNISAERLIAEADETMFRIKARRKNPRQ